MPISEAGGSDEVGVGARKAQRQAGRRFSFFLLPISALSPEAMNRNVGYAGTTRRTKPVSAGAGLSLIELLVVLAIVAAMAGAAVLAFPDLGARGSEADARRVHGLIVLACERAERGGRDIGIAVGGNGLRFGPFVGAVWQPLPDSPSEALRPRRFSTATTLSLRLDGRASALPDEPPEAPQLACLSIGERTPFELLVRGEGGLAWRIRAGAFGAIEFDGMPGGRGHGG